MPEQEGAEAGLTGAGHTFSSDSLGVAARNPSKRRTPGLERVSRPVSYDCPEIFMGEQSMHLLPFPMGAITQIRRLRPAGCAGGQGKGLGACCQGHWCPLGVLNTSHPLPDAQREADLKSVDQNPHRVPDAGSAGPHCDFGSFGGNCRERKARSERCRCVCGGQLKEESRGRGYGEESPSPTVSVLGMSCC